MCETMISAGAGLAGAIIGGFMTYLSVNKQLKFEREKINKQKEEQTDIAISIIKTFLIDEIKHNYNEMKNTGEDFLKILKREVRNDQRGLGNYKFVFSDYNKIKYDIIKYKVSIIKDTVDIYKTFEYLKENEKKKYGDLTELEKEFLKNGIIKCENMIKS